MYEVPIKYVLKGDREACRRWMRRGAVMMGQLENQMSYRDLQQGVMRRWITPDVLIECDCRFGLRTVTITTAPVSVVTTQEPVEITMSGVVVAVSCSSGLFMHYGGWKSEEFAPGVLQYGHHMTIPDGYQFQTNVSQYVTQHYWMARWAFWTEEERLATVPRQFVDQWFSFWVQYKYNEDSGGSERRADERYAWNTPAIMPGFGGKDYFLAYNILYAADDPRIVSVADNLRLTELTLQRQDEDGRQERTTKWIFALRKLGTAQIGNGILYDVAPMPERNGVRRFMATPRNTFHREGLFIHISVRNQYVLRTFNLTMDMLAPLFPPEYDFAERNDRSFYDASAYMDAEGRIHIMGTWNAGLRRGTYKDDNRDEATTKWSAALVFITLPALPYDIATEEEEEAYILERMTLRAVPWSDFLPLLDLLHPGTHEGLKGLPGGPRSKNSGQPVLMLAMERDPSARTYVQYTIDGVTYHPGRRPWNPANEDIDIWESNSWDGVRVKREAALDVLGYCVHDGGMPADSVLFHSGGDQRWHSWSRMFGGLSIDPVAGMRRVDMTWPDDIARDGMKPVTTWAGNDLYCCVCFDTCARRVENVYIGTPFDTAEQEAWWTRLPLVTDEWRAQDGNAIMHVRPALVTRGRVVLLAVVRVGETYRVAFCDAAPAQAMLDIRGILPLGDEEETGERDHNFMTFDICDYGGEFAELLKSYPSPPRAVDALAYSTEYRYHDVRNGTWDTEYGEWTFTEEWD